MRILLDESLPRPLVHSLIGHDVSTVRDESWTSLTNGALLRQAANTFDAVLTADQNIEFQQNLTTLPLAVVVMVAESNRLESLEPLVPAVLEALKTLKPRTLIRVGVNAMRLTRGGRVMPILHGNPVPRPPSGAAGVRPRSRQATR